MSRSMSAGNQPSEFGGLPGLYGNVDELEVKKRTLAAKTPYDQANPLEPHQTRMALTQTDPADKESAPAYGDGGVRIA